MQNKKITKEQIKQELGTMLGLSEKMEEDANLLEMGLSSVQIMQLSGRWRKLGYRCRFGELIQNPSVQGWEAILSRTERPVVLPEKKEVNMMEPFDMTDVQYAYWAGRKSGQQLGNVGCHGYLEIDGKDLDPQRLNLAWETVQMHHPMLRVCFTKDGKQQIRKAPYRSGIQVYDFKGKDAAEHLQQLRDTLSHRLLDIENGQVAEISLSCFGDGSTRIHFDIDLLVADVKSYQIILRDLLDAYQGRPLRAPREWNFAQYLHHEKIEGNEKQKAAAEYWNRKLPTLSGAPELPIGSYGTELEQPRFVRRKAVLKKEKWQVFQQTSAGFGITPAMALLAVYSKVVERWSEKKRFLMNIPVFNRDSDQEGMEDVVADFTNLLLLEVEPGKETSFVKLARRIQSEFHESSNYMDYSGVQIQRDYLKLHPDKKTVAPVVFSCNLGIPLVSEEFEAVLGKMGYMISQTPQVWLDFQLFDVPEGLLLIWDGVDAVFPNGLLDDMFQAFLYALEELTADKAHWEKELTVDLTPQLELRKGLEVLEEQTLRKTLHEGFFRYAQKNPQKTALTEGSTGKSISYGQLSERARSIAAFLINAGACAGDCIGISIRRGIPQIAAVLGILAMGGNYTSIGAAQPLKRKEIICRKANMKFLLSDEPELQKDLTEVCACRIDEAWEEEPLQSIADPEPESLAYIIFTSGSTGIPKGVRMTHAAAANTVYDINQRYQVGEQDCAYAISALDFDLSVYDLFGLLSAGGSLVLPGEEEKRNAGAWLSALKKYPVTIWNSVPALLEMMLIETEGAKVLLDRIRLVLQSGDWIGLELPQRMQQVAAGSVFVAMGGATEGGIWSNYCNVSLPLPKSWKSIPYGRPLSNQKYRVMDRTGEDCPDWVPGELWIGGSSLADGYAKEPELTTAQFVEKDGEHWYRTGDFGRFWSDGTMEFLGRRDHQVKVKGHRIELEEIEQIYHRYPSVEKSIVLPIERESHGKQLTAFVVPKERERAENLFSILVETEKREIEMQRERICMEEQTEAKHISMEEFEQMTVRGICEILGRIGWNCRKQEVYDIQKEAERIGILRDFQKLLEQWFLLLEQSGLVKRIPDGTCRNLQELTEATQGIRNCEALPPEFFSILKLFLKHAGEFLTGKMDAAAFMVKYPNINIDRFADLIPGAVPKNMLLVKTAAALIQKRAGDSSSLAILILGARKLNLVQQMISKVSDKTVTFMIADSPFCREEVREAFGDDERVMFVPIETLCGDELLLSEKRFDVVLSFDFLHKEKDIITLLRQIEKMLKLQGVLLAGEAMHNLPLEWITAALLEKGFQEFADVRNGQLLPLLSRTEWEQVLLKAGFAACSVYASSSRFGCFEENIMAAYSTRERETIDAKDLHAFLKEYLPDYMIPAVQIYLDQMPVTDNGKVDRKKLAEYGKREEAAEEKTTPSRPFERDIAKIWSQMLRVKDVFLEDDFYLLGGDSLIATKMGARIKKEMGLDIAAELIFQKPVFGAFVLGLSEYKNQKEYREDLPKVFFEPEKTGDPFPLTEIQQSYWIGKSGVYELGDVGAHCYFEMKCKDLEPIRLTEAWNALIERHDMLRAVVLPDGRHQQILPDVPVYSIKVLNLEGVGEAEGAENIRGVRQEMAGRVFDAEKWPLFEIRLTRLSAGEQLLHLSFDNLVLDGFSIFHLLKEWREVYHSGVGALKPVSGNFRSYVLALEKIKETKRYDADLRYWKERAAALPDAPQLPLEENGKEQRFRRFEMRLPAEKWSILRQRAQTYRLTKTVLFLGAYAEVLGKFSGSRHFTLNLTRFAKLPLYDGIENLVGDFTSLTLLEIDGKKGSSFLERCKNVQNQLLEDLQHSLVSGIAVERELNQARRETAVTMPVVFTSGFGINENNEDPDLYFGDMVYGESQTPQVWLDHQIFEQKGELIISWDALLSVFPEGLAETMFQEYQKMLDALCEETLWKKQRANLIGDDAIFIIEKKNWEFCDSQNETLLSLFEKSAARVPGRIAVESEQIRLTYAQLKEKVDRLAVRLCRPAGAEKEVIAVMLEKGYEQIVAALAILKAGAAYLPIDIENPQERILRILNQAKAAVIVTKSTVAERFQLASEQITVIDMEKIPEEKNLDFETVFPVIGPEDLAYVIFTSGSTGIPKGVMIEHCGAVNTILDVNRRFLINEADTAIFLSSFNFDLSVYDIFGMLAAGGKIAIPNAKEVQNPSEWIRIIRDYGVTVWNTVPAFMEMLVEYPSAEKEKIQNSFKTVMLSGDWIPVGLPDKIRSQFGNISLVAMGGATEASIWSNYFLVPDRIPEEWRSIPYGKPLTNQRYYILNADYEKCPVWVKGELYIAGQGLASGYFGAAEKTKEAFLEPEQIGERIYRTGDFGRYLPGGDIEFLGRADTQIKLNGHRIELGEIQAQISKIAGIKECAVTIDRKHARLVNHIVVEEIGSVVSVDRRTAVDVPELKTELAQIGEQRKEKVDIPEQEQIAAYFQAVDRLCTEMIFSDLKQLGIFPEQGEAGKRQELFKAAEVSDTGKKILNAYLNVLEEFGIRKRQGEREGLIQLQEVSQMEEVWLTSHGLSESHRKLLEELKTQLAANQEIRLDLLRGTRDAEELLTDPSIGFLTPDRLGRYDVTNERMDQWIFEILQDIGKVHQSLRVAEIASRAQNKTELYLEALKANSNLDYTCMDESSYYLDLKKQKFGDRIHCVQTDLCAPAVLTDAKDNKYDLVIVNNTLHRFSNLDDAIYRIKNMLAPGGRILLAENVRHAPLMFLTVAFLEHGYQNLRDFRRKKGLPLLPSQEWAALVEKEKLGQVEWQREAFGKMLVLIRATEELPVYNLTLLKEKIREKLPEYMVPALHLQYRKLPCSENGKIDRKELERIGSAGRDERKKIRILPENETEEKIAKIWKQVLNYEDISTNDNFFERGGDSLKAILLLSALKESAGYDVTLQKLYQNPSISQLAKCVVLKEEKEISYEIDCGMIS